MSPIAKYIFRTFQATISKTRMDACSSFNSNLGNFLGFFFCDIDNHYRAEDSYKTLKKGVLMGTSVYLSVYILRNSCEYFVIYISVMHAMLMCVQ